MCTKIYYFQVKKKNYTFTTIFLSEYDPKLFIAPTSPIKTSNIGPTPESQVKTMLEKKCNLRVHMYEIKLAKCVSDRQDMTIRVHATFLP